MTMGLSATSLGYLDPGEEFEVRVVRDLSVFVETADVTDCVDVMHVYF
jgi:hypothetical protein